MRILGLDVGSKSIGVSMSDEVGMCAHSLCTLQRKGTIGDTEAIVTLCKRWGITSVVIGLPLTCEGIEGHRASRVRVLGDSISAKGLCTIYVDESFSTVEAEDILLASNVSRKRRKQVVDQLAASIILQRYLDKFPHEDGGHPPQHPPTDEKEMG